MNALNNVPRLLTYSLLAVLIFQGLSGLAGGFGLVGDPSGAALGMPLEWLDGSPFSTYLVPGLILLVVLGIGPLIVAFMVVRAKTGAGWASVATGIALLVWIGVEVAIIGYQPFPPQVPFQILYGAVGAIILALGLRYRSRLSA